MKNNIILTGGGTMGHISPNLALIPYLVNNFSEIHYIGSHNGIEKEKINNLQKTIPNLFYHPINTTKLTRKSVLKNIKIPFVLMSSITSCKKLIKEIKPTVIFSKGGYVSVPVVIGAKKLNIPIVIHESDLSMGLANKIASKRATTICTTFPETAKKYGGVFTGSPVNNNLLFEDPTPIIKKYKLNNGRKTIAITGGSLGSTPINNAIFNALPSLTNKYNIIHLTGKGKKIDFVSPFYHQEEFSNEIGKIFKASDLVITRAGSNTIFELALLNRPMLLIPLSKKASRGDQIENANYFKKLNIAHILLEEDLNNIEKAISLALNDVHKLKINLLKADFKNGTPLLLNEIKKASKLKR